MMLKTTHITIKDRTDIRGIYRTGLLLFAVLSLIGTVPYLLSGTVASFADALFESVSGLTTTGATCIRDEQSVPQWIIAYRAFTQWAGGALILVFLASLLKDIGSDSSISTNGTTSQLYSRDIRFYNMMLRLLVTYAVMTVLCFVLLAIAGLNMTDALTYTMSVVSTGGRVRGDMSGMSVTGGVRAVILIFMMLSCINYTVYYHIAKKHFSRIRNSSELSAYFFILAAGSILIIICLTSTGKYAFRDAVRYGLFETVSYSSTTGINAADVSAWPSPAKIILTLLTYTGGCSASVGSGLKVLRVVIMGKLIARSFISRIHPNSVTAIKMNGKPVSSDALKSVISHFLAMSAFFVAGVFLISFEAPSLGESLRITSFLINNTGGGLLSDYSGFMKCAMCILMLAGRLEFHALLIPFVKDKSK